MRSIGAQPASLLLPFIALVFVSWASTARAETPIEKIYGMYVPMFRYWCLSAEQRYAYERPMPGRLTNRNSRAETCERLAAIYSDRLKHFASADVESHDDTVIETIQFVGQACIDMQMIAPEERAPRALALSRIGRRTTWEHGSRRSSAPMRSRTTTGSSNGSDAVTYWTYSRQDLDRTH